MAEGRDVGPSELPNETGDEMRKHPKARGRNSKRSGGARRSLLTLAARRHRAYIQPPPSHPRRAQTTKEEQLLVQPLVVQLPAPGLGQAPVAVLGQATTERIRLNSLRYNYGLGEHEDIEKAARHVTAMVWLLAAFRVLSFLADRLGSQHGTRDDLKLQTTFEMGSAVTILAFQLFVLACGYYGATYRSRALTCTFACGNLCFSVAASLSLFALVCRLSTCNGALHVQKQNSVLECLVWSQGSDMLFDRIAMVVAYGGDITFNAMGFCFARTLFQLQRPVLPATSGEDLPPIDVIDGSAAGAFSDDNPAEV